MVKQRDGDKNERPSGSLKAAEARRRTIAARLGGSDMPQTRDLPGQLRLPCCPEGRDELGELVTAMDRGAKPRTRTTRQKVVGILKGLGVRSIAALTRGDVDRRFAEAVAALGLADSHRLLLRKTL